MRILVLTFYYWPDLCAGSFRTTALVEELLKIPGNFSIEVLTTLPNRYATYSIPAPEQEHKNRLTIRRFSIQKHKSGLIDQALAFYSFAKSIRKHVKKQHYDLVYVTSSRLMTAALGAYIARLLKTKLYLDIRDLFVDTVGDIFSKKINLVVKPIFSKIEKWTFSSADYINTVSPGFLPYFLEKYPNQKVSCYSNGIDPEFIEALEKNAEFRRNTCLLKRIVYAGNIGEGQGLHRIVPLLAKRLEGIAEFIIIGDGGRKNALEKAINDEKCTNVILLAPQNRTDLIEQYQNADVLFLHLNDYQALHKVIPSKIFEYAAMGKPILAGASGFAASFISKEVVNAIVFSPCDLDDALNAYNKLIFTNTDRSSFVSKYKRTNIMREFAKEIITAV